MHIPLLWFLVALFVNWWPMGTDGIRVAESDAKCPLGCIHVADQPRYVVGQDDVLWMAKVTMREAGPRLIHAEASATAWAIVQGWARERTRRGGHGPSLAWYAQRYSAACSADWATGGTKYSPRITPRADACRAMEWWEIPDRWQNFVRDFFLGLMPCRTPGAYHVLARGFERWAADDLIGPIYVTTEEEYAGGNAYYKTDDTASWDRDLVRIVPARDWP